MADQVLAFGTAPSGVTFGDAPVTVSATSTSPTAVPSGIAITYSSLTTTICTNVGTTVTIVGAGTCTIAADELGDGINYKPAPQKTQSFGIAKAPTSFVAPTATDKVFTGLAAPTTTLAGSLAPVGTPPVFPTGNVSITVMQGTTTAATYGPLLAAGAFSTTNPKLASESYSATFHYGGDSNFNGPTDVTIPLRVEGFSTTTIAMQSARAGQSITMLADGNILVAGGASTSLNAPTASAEVFCVSQVAPVCPLATDVGMFKPTIGNMWVARLGHTATRLQDGNVLMTGGNFDTSGTPTNSAEIYCAGIAGPLCTVAGDIGTFKSISAASPMTSPRAGHTATLLNDGTVLLSGGFVDATNPPTASTELYCTSQTGPICNSAAAVGKFVGGPSMNAARVSHTATLLSDGRVLIAGGDVDGGFTSTSKADLYCAGIGLPCTAADGSIQAAPDMAEARDSHAALLLTDQRALIVGGESETVTTPVTSATAELFCSVVVNGCASLGSFQGAVNGMSTARIYHATVELTDGRVLVIGGRAAAPPSAAIGSTDLFNPLSNTFSGGPSMTTPRALPSAIRLGDGRVLVTGGRDAAGSPPASTAEVYNGPF